MASWAERQPSLTEWIIGQLADNYDVDPSTAKGWLDDNALVRLLDGLDEVSELRRAMCADEINAYRRDHGLVRIAVCSRTQETDDLRAKLGLRNAVLLLPPTDTDINHYLDRLETAGNPLTDLRAALASDEALRELVRSPLVLHVVALTYHGQPAWAFLEPGSAEHRLRRLWTTYIERMLEHRPLPGGCGYTRDQAVRWLEWIAERLVAFDQTEFHLDRLTSGWVPPPRSGRHTFLEIALHSAVHSPAEPIPGWSAAAVARNLRSLWWAAATVSLVSILGIGITISMLQDRSTAPLALTMLPVLAGGLLVLVTLGMDEPLREERITPNQAIRRSAKSAAATGIPAALLFGGMAGAVPAAGVTEKLLLGTVLMLVAGFQVGMHFGGRACVKHYAVRILLVQAGVAPWRYARFLDAMAERGFLRRNGSGYLFIHGMLRDHFAYRLIGEAAFNDTPKE